MSFELLGTLNRVRRKSNKGYDVLSPIYELLLNAVNAECNNEKVDKDVTIEIEYTTKEIHKKKYINYIKISDYGVGFSEDNFQSFKNLYSSTNQKLGCKGVGRFQIMRSFHQIKVKSFDDNKRFSFDLAECNYNQNNIEGFSEKQSLNSCDAEAKKTVVECVYDIAKKNKDFDDAIPMAAPDEEDVKEKIFSKLLLKLILLKKSEFCIDIKLQGKSFITNTDIDDLSDIEQSFTIKDIDDKFTIYHLVTNRIKAKTNECRNYITYVADAVEVTKDTSFFQGKSKFLYEDDEKKRYIGIIESDYLNKHVSDNREEFDIKQETFDSITESCNEQVERKLKKELEKYYSVQEDKINRVNDMYPFLKVKDRCFEYKPDDTEDDIAEKGYIYLAKKGFKSFNGLKERLLQFNEKIADNIKDKQGTLFPETSLKEEICNIADAIQNVRKDSLARAVTEEYVILRLLEEYIKQESKESCIHELVFPRFKKYSNEEKEAYDKANLWLIDDKYIGYNHEYIASDLKIEDFEVELSDRSGAANKEKRKRPDLCIFQDSEHIEPVVIIEFKSQSSREQIKHVTDQVEEYAKIISAMSSNRYSRFTLLIIQPIEKMESTQGYLNEEGWTILKESHHYMKVPQGVYNNKREPIHLTYELISIKRFAELAKKRKEKYIKALGLELPK
ncbi:putative conserved ATP-binding protein [Candidatus Fokinia solitaria]|uniref:Putative conserved ATP-binding protein n=1 Tax=Candidatus Fokinia solitaria TaxID=1802984 RepID=A0A2U8BRD6_9RICK|nr:ATP-binding protein [Candidatus Fokinia solitaria]AWD32905.1 putative conserved ATP-binding protein [Candidatus Fokinia solitaria]